MSDKIVLNPRQLTLADLKRARAGPLEGRSPFEYLEGGDPLEVAVLIGWCIRTRDDPEFTWADAEALPLDEFDWGEGDDDQPPPGGSSGEPGGNDAPPARKRSRPKPPEPEPPSSSAPSSG